MTEPVQMINLVNVLDGILQLDNGTDLRIGLVKAGATLTIPQAQTAHPLIVSCMQRGWLLPENHPTVLQMRNAPVPQSISFNAGGQDMPTQGMTGTVTPSWAPNSADNVNLPGLMQRVPQNMDEISSGGVNVSDAQSIITGGRSRPDADAVVPNADYVLRQAARGQNTTIPQYVDNTQVPTAGSIVNANRPGSPQYNTATGVPQFAPGVQVTPGVQAGGYAQVVQGQGPQQVVQTQPMAFPPQGMQFQGQQIVQHRGAYPTMQRVFSPTPTQQQVSSSAPGGTHGQLIMTQAIPGSGPVLDVADIINNPAGVDLEAATNQFLSSVQQGNRQATIMTNYKDMDETKKLNFIFSTQDLPLLYKLLAMERSGRVSVFIQNKILQLGGAIPSQAQLQNIQATMQPAVAPQSPMLSAGDKILVEYPDWDDQKKVSFIGTVKDPEFLKRLARREVSQTVNAYLTGRIAELETAIQANIQAGLAKGAMPPELNGAIEDSILKPPAPPGVQQIPAVQQVPAVTAPAPVQAVQPQVIYQPPIA